MQLTFFRCGGVCLGVAIHHSVVDGLSTFNFIRSWSNLTHTHTHIPPSLDRTHLRARSPPSITSPHKEYSLIPNSPSSLNPKSFKSSILKLSNHQISLLKTPQTLSTFKAVASHVWRSFCKARGLHASRQTRLYITADARSRLRPPLPANFFGNAVLRTSAEATVREVLEFGVPEKIGEATKRVDDEFVRSLVDYLEEKVNEAGVRRGEWAMPETYFWATSWLGLPIYEADFGWGKPVFMGRACLNFGSSFYVIPSSPEEEEGGVWVAVSMEEENMGRFKEVFYEDIGCFGSALPKKVLSSL